MIEIFHVKSGSEIIASYLKEKEALKKISWENKRYKLYNKLYSQINSLETYIKKNPNNIVKCDNRRGKYDRFDLSSFIELMDYSNHIKECFNNYCIKFDKKIKRTYHYITLQKGQLY
jgi:hypothetical protein